jgi:uncharacterized membrane protein
VLATLIISEWTWFLVAFVVAAVLFGSALIVDRRRYQDVPVLRWATFAKGLGLLLLAVALGQPLWSSQRLRPGANHWLLLADNSQSLNLVDPKAVRSRGEGLRELLTNDQAPWQVRLAQDFEVRRYQFDGQPKYVADFAGLDFQGDRSDLGRVLSTLKTRLAERPVAGLLLFTDGVATDELDGLDLSGLPPVFPVSIGATDGLVDLAITRVTTTTTSFEDAPVTLQVELNGRGLSAGPITVRVDDATGTAVKHETLTLTDPAKPPSFRFQLRPTETGVTFYRVRAVCGGDLAEFDNPAVTETTLDNNARWVAVDRGTGPYRLLYVAGRPNWELKFLRRSLELDDQLKLTSLIRIARKEAKFDFRGRDGESANPLFRGFDGVGEETERYDQPVIVRLDTISPEEFRDGFPKTAADLFQFHAIILDDLEAEFFTAEQLSLIERFVSERGGGCLMLGGLESFRQGGYGTTAIGRLLPVYLDAAPRIPPPSGYRLALTRDGWLQPWARLRSTETDEVRRLRELAAFRTLNTISGAKPGATVIAEVTDAQGQTSPALVEHRYGQGRAATLLIGDLWRSQLELADDQRAADDLGKAWRQMLRWLIVDVPDRVALQAIPDDSSGLPLMRLEARVRDGEFQPQDNAAVALTVQPPEGPPLTLPAEPSLREPGLYEATVAGRPGGRWTATVDVRDPEGQPLGQGAAGWAANLLAEELRQITPDREALERLAAQTGGRVVEAADLERFVGGLSSRDVPVMETTITPLWHHPLMWLLIAGCLAVDWGVRRRHGLA